MSYTKRYTPEAQQEVDALERALFLAKPNSVVYSERAEAVARKSSGFPVDDSWHIDASAWRRGALTSKQMVHWVEDWQFMEIKRGGVPNAG